MASVGACCSVDRHYLEQLEKERAIQRNLRSMREEIEREDAAVKIQSVARVALAKRRVRRVKADVVKRKEDAVLNAAREAEAQRRARFQAEAAAKIAAVRCRSVVWVTAFLCDDAPQLRGIRHAHVPALMIAFLAVVARMAGGAVAGRVCRTSRQ